MKEPRHLHSKVEVPKLVTYLYWTPICEWYVVWCVSKNGYEKDMCLKEIGLKCSNHANHSSFNGQLNLGGPIWSFNEQENFHRDIFSKIFI